MSELLFYGGIATCSIAVIGAIIAAIILRLFRIRINKRLENEYGKRRN